MATVLFYEKPGCINNTRQKKLLSLAGHTVVAKDLLNTPWNRDTLMEFLSAMPVEQWFNPSAPRLKSGEIKPASCSVEQAMELLLSEPILIRRPLMKVGHDTMVGFDQQAVDRWIGLQSTDRADLESCPRGHQDSNRLLEVKAENS